MLLMRNRVFCVLVFLCWAILLHPFPVTVFLAVCLACLCLPHYRRLSNCMQSRYAMLLVLLAATLSILLPIALVVIMVLPQAVNGMKVLDQLRESGWLHGTEAQRLLDSIDYYLRMLPGMEDGLRQLMRQAADLAVPLVRAGLANSMRIATNFLHLAFNIFLMMALAMAAMLHAPTLHDYARLITQCPVEPLDRFAISIRTALHAVLAGVVFVAVLQGTLCGIAFAFTGVPQAAFWGLLSAFVAPVPLVGTAMVWIPACLYLWFTGASASAVGLALWCIIVVVGADNVLRPYFLQGGIDAPFVVVLVAVLCGLIAFGPVGLVAGPVLMAFALQAAREAKSAELL
ncbi:MAG: AI-2E family transporter [Deltaproteobacteria bacterium]|jgi:predicted PurR-regulated permease PerM|nr:AI-2E family transporter [Deltaproteobacteria bacterium]